MTRLAVSHRPLPTFGHGTVEYEDGTGREKRTIVHVHLLEIESCGNEEWTLIGIRMVVEEKRLFYDTLGVMMNGILSGGTDGGMDETRELAFEYYKCEYDGDTMGCATGHATDGAVGDATGDVAGTAAGTAAGDAGGEEKKATGIDAFDLSGATRDGDCAMTSATGPTGSSEAAIAIPQIQCDCFPTQAARGRAGSRQPFDAKLMPA
nr:hypothetical protein CFP56_78809 [Quercus suber]